jgi:hypothetical protein
LETFDPKPDAPPEYNNSLKAIDTNVPGMKVHEWLPELAKCADLYSVIRSMTHPHNGHEIATYLMQTGRMPGGGDVYPAIGAVLAMMKSKKEYKGDLPPYVILTRAKGRFSEIGFLGDEYAPLITGGNPNASAFIVDGIVPPGGLTKENIAYRLICLSRLIRLPLSWMTDLGCSTILRMLGLMRGALLRAMLQAHLICLERRMKCVMRMVVL